MSQYDAQSNNKFNRNVRQYTDLDLFFGKKSSNSDVQEITDALNNKNKTNFNGWRRF